MSQGNSFEALNNHMTTANTLPCKTQFRQKTFLGKFIHTLKFDTVMYKSENIYFETFLSHPSTLPLCCYEEKQIVKPQNKSKPKEKYPLLHTD